jgi:hypothetical protein
MMSRHVAKMSAMCLTAALVAGCSNAYERAPVRGSVMCDGKPTTGAVILFQPLDVPEKTGRPPGHPGGASTGTVGEDGTFTLVALDGTSGEGALIGPHQVIFQPPPTTRPKLSADDRSSLTPEEIKHWEEEYSRRPVYPKLPCSNNVTPAEVEVKLGENQFEFTLQSK